MHSTAEMKKSSYSPSMVDLSGMEKLSLSGSNNRTGNTSPPYLAANVGSHGPSVQNGGSLAPYGNGNRPCSIEEMRHKYHQQSPSISPSMSSICSSDTLDSSMASSGLGSQNSSLLSKATLSAATNASLADYLSQLVRDRKMMSQVPGVFGHVGRLLDEEINKVRSNLFQLDIDLPEPVSLPECDGAAKSEAISEKVFVPVDEYPDFNFVGRILGPRGLTAKQLEKQMQCKIMIRGKGSMRDKAKEATMTGRAGWEHLSEKLHVLVTVEDTMERAKIKLERAVEAVNKLLVPVEDEQDELKKRQLMELAILNGTCYDKSMTPPNSGHGMSPMHLEQAARVQMLNSIYAAQRNAMFVSPQLHARAIASPQIPASPRSFGSPDVAMGQTIYTTEWPNFYPQMAPAMYGGSDGFVLEGVNGQFYAAR